VYSSSFSPWKQQKLTPGSFDVNDARNVQPLLTRAEKPVLDMDVALFQVLPGLPLILAFHLSS